MTAGVEQTPAQLSQQQLAVIFQYTVEAYKTFQKLAENLPNPMTAKMFSQFAADERGNRDLLEMKALAMPFNIRATVGNDLAFQDIHEGELSWREATEFLIGRERTIQKRLRDLSTASGSLDRNLLVYLESMKRAHIVELERELQLLQGDGDWWIREDAETRLVHGAPQA